MSGSHVWYQGSSWEGALPCWSTTGFLQSRRTVYSSVVGKLHLFIVVVHEMSLLHRNNMDKFLSLILLLLLAAEGLLKSAKGIIREITSLPFLLV